MQKYLEIVPIVELVPVEYVRINLALLKRKESYLRKRKFELKYKDGV